MFGLIKDAAKTLLGMPIPPQELAEKVVRSRLRAHGIDDATIPQIAISNIAQDALANGKDPSHVAFRITAVVAQIASELASSKGQAVLGGMYDNGQGAPQNDAMAVLWYRKAAEQGDARAQYNLGVMYAQGQRVLQDYAQAAV
jgi:TPR repeat protein